jgi:hypothetical protein
MSRHVPPPARRWAISFADLALLIACTLMLGWRPAATADGATDVAASVLAEQPVAAMFVPGEAMLSARGLALLAPAQRVVADGGRVWVAVGMGPVGSQRLDAWELAAARTAVIARALGSERVVLAAPEADARVRIASVR